MNCKPIPGFPDYEVSDCGRVFSLNYMETGKRRELKQSKESNGRFRVELRKNGQNKSKLVHRLVLEAFVGPCPAGMECCHNDGDCLNNHLSNLRWDTKQSNEKDKILHKTYRAKLTEANVILIRTKYAAGGITQTALAEQFGVVSSQINHIINRKSWTHI